MTLPAKGNMHLKLLLRIRNKKYWTKDAHTGKWYLMCTQVAICAKPGSWVPCSICRPFHKKIKEKLALEERKERRIER